MFLLFSGYLAHNGAAALQEKNVASFNFMNSLRLFSYVDKCGESFLKLSSKNNNSSSSSSSSARNTRNCFRYYASIRKYTYNETNLEDEISRKRCDCISVEIYK